MTKKWKLKQLGKENGANGVLDGFKQTIRVLDIDQPSRVVSVGSDIR